MNKTNKQFLAYAVALAASFSTVPGISHAAAAAEPSAAAAPVMQADAAVQNVPSAAEEKTEAPKEQQAGEAAQTSAKAESENTQADERAKEWNKNRPQDKAIEDIENGNVGTVPDHIKTSSTTYKYPHDYKGAYVVQQYLPNNLKNKKYYIPKDIGYEKQIKEIYSRLEQLKQQK